MSTVRYVYAVTRPFRAPLPVALTGVAGAPAHTVAEGGLVAVVSSVPEADFAEVPLRRRLDDPVRLAELTRAHDNVVAALVSVTSPLPLRLATVRPDDDAVRELLAYGRARFVPTLERLEGRLEWGVTVYPEGFGRRTGEPVGAVPRLLHERLARHAEAVRTGPGTPRPGETGEPGESGESGPVLLDAAYLVRRAACAAFVEEFNRLIPRAPGVRVVLSGPRAPYSFVTLAGGGSPAGSPRHPGGGIG
ncbi:gas vesicle protein [Streptomyces inusitatus]|uniref:Gas vesicle protein n=1 Tax=Streptomyces inusitatus TaxID=68221 RepID=A0A918Q3I1_9ACTN|nr:GvpL/GvpF family gas vesicle protein [Streptomyces inusitatus]GGZ30019.1 gas vesicle protein [Streptomyces inusitatus]